MSLAGRCIGTLLTGMALIVGGGIYLGYREVIAARRLIQPAPTAEAVFVPVSPAGALVHLAGTADDRMTSSAPLHERQALSI